MNVHAPKYAHAMYNLASSKNEELSDYEELCLVKASFDEFPEYFDFLKAESLSSNKRMASFDRVYKDEVSKYVLSFVKILIRDSMIACYDDVVAEYRRLLDGSMGIIRGIVYSAHEIDDERLEKISEKLSSRLGSKIDLTIKIDPSVIGGMKIFVKDTMIDYSLDTRLESVKKKLHTSEKSA